MADYKLRQIIEKKRDGKALTTDDIGYFVQVVTQLTTSNGEKTPDRSQIGAMLMAMYLNGLNDTETNQLTLKMRDSGSVLEWPKEIKHIIVDKHSTGGVGDKISLVLAPALAACNLLVPMVSGRSLGHTGGTLDKLEAIKGLTVNQSDDQIRAAVQRVGCCIVGQTSECVPADKILYECRDLTSTIDYPPLIIASIASKKLSESLAAIVYDVKFGRGSFFKSQKEALQTAKGLVIASQPVKAVALLTSMENPIGRFIGDSLEVLESVECLKGGGPADVIELTEAFGNELFHLTTEGNKCNPNDIRESLRNGKALDKFHQMILQQGATIEAARELCYGDSNIAFREANRIKISEFTYTGIDGYVESIDPLVLGNIWKEEYSLSHNPHVGFVLVKVVTENIHSGDVWLKFYHEREEMTKEQKEKLSKALQVTPQKSERKLIEKRVIFRNGLLVVEDY